MSDIKDTDINPETGRNRKGQFAPGNQAARKRKPSEVTADLRRYADAENLSLLAVKKLQEYALNRGNKYSENASIRACETLLKHFNITMEKDIDKEIAENANETINEQFEFLKKVAK